MAGPGHKSGEYSAVDPSHGPRISVLETTVNSHADRIDDHGRRLGMGDMAFVKIQSDLGALTEKVGGLITAAWWLIAVIALGLLGTCGTALIYVLQHMGKP